jgi:acetyl-CoA acyltransferase
MSDVVIIDAVRTPLGKGRRGGALAGVHPVDLLAHPLAALVERAGIDPGVIDDVIAGCVSQIGEQSTNIARRAVLAAGYPERVPATTVDRQCGSAQQAIHFAAQGVLGARMT